MKYLYLVFEEVDALVFVVQQLRHLFDSLAECRHKYAYLKV